MTEFEETILEWESHDGWQFADREAERKFFFERGLFVAETYVANKLDNTTASQYVSGRECCVARQAIEECEDLIKAKRREL